MRLGQLDLCPHTHPHGNSLLFLLKGHWILSATKILVQKSYLQRASLSITESLIHACDILSSHGKHLLFISWERGLWSGHPSGPEAYLKKGVLMTHILPSLLSTSFSSG